MKKESNEKAQNDFVNIHQNDVSSTIKDSDHIGNENPSISISYETCIFIAIILCIFLIYFSKKIRAFLDGLIDNKFLRWFFSYFLLPVTILWLSPLVESEYQRYVFALAVVVSIAISERSSALTKQKHEDEVKEIEGINDTKLIENNKLRDDEISGIAAKHADAIKEKELLIAEKDLSIEKAKREIVSRVQLLRNGYVIKLFNIASDHAETDCVAIKNKIKIIAEEIMTTSGLLNTMEEVEVGLRNTTPPLPNVQAKMYEMMIRRK